MTDLAIDRVQGRIERLQSDTLHAYDPAYDPSDRRSGATDGGPSPQANAQAPLSCAAPPGAFLVVDDEGGRRRYVREASLELRGDTIVDDEGHPLLGYPAGGPSGQLGPLRLQRRDGLLDRAIALRIDDEGRVAYARRLTDVHGAAITQWVPVGRVALATLDGGVAHLAPPGEQGLPLLSGAQMQGGRVDLIRALERLQEAYLQLDALRAARVAEDAAERSALGIVK